MSSPGKPRAPAPAPLPLTTPHPPPQRFALSSGVPCAAVHGFNLPTATSPNPVSTSTSPKSATTSHQNPTTVTRPHQYPCTPAHGSPNAKTILPLSIHGEGQGGEVFFCGQGGEVFFCGQAARSSSGHSVSRQHQRPRRSRTGLTKEKTKTYLGSTSSWAKAHFPPAPEPVHSRARLAKCQNNSPPLSIHGEGQGGEVFFCGGKALRSSSGSRRGQFSSQRQKILRAQRPFVVINSPQNPGPTHQRTHIFTRKFFQMVCQLLSEHRCLGVNNPGIVDWE